MRKVLWAMAALMVAGAAPAWGATATIGSALAPGATYDNLPGCAGGFDCVAFTQYNSSPVAVVPFDGFVTTWRVRAGSNGSPVQLRVLRPDGTGSYTAVGTSATQMTTAGAAADEYPSDIPVKKGDILGIGNNSSALLYADTASALYSVRYWKPAVGGQPVLPDGTTKVPTDNYGMHEVAMNATITESEADLALGLLGSPDPVGVGQDLSYLVSITNNGPRAAEAVSVSDQLPSGVTPKSATPTVGTCTNGATVTCDLGTIASGKTETVTIVVTPTASGSIANAASVTSATPDPNPGNNAATVTTTVTEQPPQTHSPLISSLSFTPATFRLGSFLPTAAAVKKKPPIGTTVQYLVADATKVTLSFQLLRKGKKPRAAGSLTRNAPPAGATPGSVDRFRFSGRLSATRKLKPGRYRVTAVAKYGTLKSGPVRKTIRVLKR